MGVDFNTIKLLWPECVLTLAALYMFVAGTFPLAKLEQRRMFWTVIAIAAQCAAAFALLYGQWTLWRGGEAAHFPSGPIAVDFFAFSLRLAAIVAGLLLTLTLWRNVRDELASEHLGILLLAVAGVMLTVSANELVFLFLGLELVSIPTYILLFLGGRTRESLEASMKYFFLSIFSTAALLYGFSFLYGMTGTTYLPFAREALLTTEASPAMATVATALILAGLGFRLAAVPFHFYAPDVYQGTSSANAGLLAVLPKIAGLAALARLLPILALAAGDFVWQSVVVLAILTMTVGNVCALWQTRIRRLMAWSSVAHSGYMMIGLAVGLAAAELERAGEQGGPAGLGGYSAMWLYLIVYAAASLGVFAALASLGEGDREPDRLDELAGLSRTRPALTAALAVFMFSLTGLPPLAGFWGKLALITGAAGLATQEGASLVGFWWFLILAVFAVLNTAIGAGYYLRIIAVTFFQGAGAAAPARHRLPWAATAACAAIVLVIGFWPGAAVRPASVAEQSLAAPVAQSASPPSISRLSSTAP